MIVANWDEPISLDPTNMNGSAIPVANLMFDRLVVLDKDLEPHGALAESWEVAPDGKAYTFKLRKGVKFHDGTPFTADAVKTNLDRLIAGPLKANFLINLTSIYDHTEIVDDLTAKVVLKQLFAPFLAGLSEGFYAIISPAALQKYGDSIGQNPVGTGPFIFQEWVSKSHVAVKKNPDYAWGSEMYKHQGPPFVDSVSVRLIPDTSTRMLTVETGEVHFEIDFPPDQVDRLKQNPKLTSSPRSPRGRPASST